VPLANWEQIAGTPYCVHDLKSEATKSNGW
jgi:hypothetical protein